MEWTLITRGWTAFSFIKPHKLTAAAIQGRALSGILTFTPVHSNDLMFVQAFGCCQETPEHAYAYILGHPKMKPKKNQFGDSLIIYCL